MSEGNDKKEEENIEEHNLEARVKKALAELEMQEDTVQGIYEQKFNLVKDALSQSLKKKTTDILHPLLEIETTEIKYNKTLKNLLAILEGNEKAKNYFPSEILYNRYVAALKKAIVASNKILALYSEQFKFVSEALAEMESHPEIIPTLPTTAEILRKLDKLADVIAQEFPAVFEHIELAHNLKKQVTPEKKDELDELVSSYQSSDRLGFESHSDQTFQRLPRYVLLFNEVGKTLKTYESLTPDYEDFKKYLFTKAKPRVTDLHTLSEQDVEDHMKDYFKSKVGYENAVQIKKVAAIAKKVDKIIGTANTPTMSKTPETEESSEKPSMLKRFQSLQDLTKKPKTDAVPSRRSNSLDSKN